MARHRLLAVALLVLLPHAASAHFVLRSPASWRIQDADGNPQKTGPCGDEGTAAPSGIVTAFAPGDTVTITIDETIFHPGPLPRRARGRGSERAAGRAAGHAGRDRVWQRADRDATGVSRARRRRPRAR